MKLSTLLVINTIYALIGALGMLFIPEQLWGPYGVTLDTTSLLLSRFFGGVLISVAFVSWFSRNTKDQEVQRGLCYGFALTHLISLVLAYTAMNSGMLNQTVWVDVVIHGLLAIGFGYYIFSKK